MELDEDDLENVAQSDSYQAATCRLGSAEDMPEATGLLILEQPND